MLWLNETREQIKKENPGIKITEIAKKGGEMWKELKDKSKWEEKAAKDKQRYLDEMKDYKPTAGGHSDEEDTASKSKSPAKKRKKESPTKKSVNTSGSFKSKEYISDDDSSSSEDKKKETKSEDELSEPEKKKNKVNYSQQIEWIISF